MEFVFFFFQLSQNSHHDSFSLSSYEINFIKCNYKIKEHFFNKFILFHIRSLWCRHRFFSQLVYNVDSQWKFNATRCKDVMYLHSQFKKKTNYQMLSVDIKKHKLKEFKNNTRNGTGYLIYFCPLKLLLLIAPAMQNQIPPVPYNQPAHMVALDSKNNVYVVFLCISI